MKEEVLRIRDDGEMVSEWRELTEEEQTARRRESMERTLRESGEPLLEALADMLTATSLTGLLAAVVKHGLALREVLRERIALRREIANEREAGSGETLTPGLLEEESLGKLMERAGGLLDAFYLPGQSITYADDLCVSGYINDTADKMTFSVPAPPHVSPQVTGVMATAVIGAVRGTAGYVENSGNSLDWLSSPLYTIKSDYQREQNIIRLFIIKSTDFGNAAENTPAVLTCRAVTLKFI